MSSLFDEFFPPVPMVAKPKRPPWAVPEVDGPPAIEVSLGHVPNAQPTVAAPYRLAIIGEAPGSDEVRLGQPFVGQSGRFLDQVLSKAGIARSVCFIGNICNDQPPGNDISRFARDGKYIQQGLTTLGTDISRFQPHVCLLLGKTALWAASGSMKLDEQKCYFFLGTRPPFEGIKCIATWHPAAALRQYGDYSPWITFAVTKAKTEAYSKELKLPLRTFEIALTREQVCQKLGYYEFVKQPISIDIEGGINDMSCCSFSPDSSYAFIVPFERIDGTNYWENEEDEVAIWEQFISILSNPEVPKVLQNGLYDRFVLQKGYNVIVRGHTEDTMLKHFSNLCELEKSLATQISIYCGTESYHKQDRKTDDQDTFYRYCCKDASTTMEICQKLDKYLDAGQIRHYRENIELLHPLLYMELRGIRYNADLALQRLEEMKVIIYETQENLDTIGRDLGVITSVSYTEAFVREICCYKKDQTKTKKDYEESLPTILQILNLDGGTQALTVEQRGYISSKLGLTLNIKSPKFKDFLYKTCKLPTQYKKDLKTKEMRPTTEYKALLKLSKSHPPPALNVALELSRLRTRAQMLAMPSLDGRMHASYNLVGTETGRLSCSKSILQTKASKRVGANLTTIPGDWDLEDDEHPLTQGMRDLFLADDGCYIGKLDLKGADGYTIGALLASLGENTMLEDLKAGIKPAQVVALNVMEPGCTSGKSRDEIKQMIKKFSPEEWKEKWEYFVSKQLTWGYCYTLGPFKASDLVFIESEGKVNLDQKQIKIVFNAIESRYHPTKLHRWMEQHMSSQNYPAKLIAPNGFSRKFFSRNFGSKCECLGEALAHLPQVITTHTINRAMHRLWTDPANRRDDTLIVEPLHSVHDELVPQWKIEDTDFAVTKLKEWFDNPIVIRGIKVSIPVDGTYGLNWAMQGDDIKGTI